MKKDYTIAVAGTGYRTPSITRRLISVNNPVSVIEWEKQRAVRAVGPKDQRNEEEEAVVICPVDPYVEDDYFKTIEALGNRAAESEANLVLMGIEPTYPSEKYGYIIPKSKENISE